MTEPELMDDGLLVLPRPNPIHARIDSPARTFARCGSLEVLATRDADLIQAAQELRYEVFFEEGGARAGFQAALTRCDADHFDGYCDHLVVIDHAAPAQMRVVGTYRMLDPEGAARAGGFYSAAEFRIADLARRRPGWRIVELGRSCVRRTHRDRRTLELLWGGIWSMIQEADADMMIGCASFEGTHPERHALPLSFLHHHHRAPDADPIRAVDARHVAMDMLPAETVDARSAWRALPPLIKGYLNLGATIGDGAVIDHDFGTTDVLVMLDRRAIQARYKRRFGADQREAA